ncbi:MAG: hypothetical protein ACP5N3_04195 [Candidatus Nanoarchaeia archaeon]
MNKKAQIFTPITMMFMVLCFIIVWALFGASFLNNSIQQAMDTGYFNGIEAWGLSALPFIIFIALIVAIIALGYYSANQ